MALAATLACSACAPLLPVAYRDDLPLTVTLPLARAGVRDEREAFARLFDDALRSESGRASEAARDWLHGTAPPDADAAPASDALRARLAAIQAAFETRAAATSVLLVPGLFGDCVSAQSVPFGDGVLRTPQRSPDEAYGAYAALGLHAIRLVPLPGRAPSAANALRLAEALRREAAAPGVRHIVVVAYSKGIADTLEALDRLAHDGGIPPELAAVVSVAGAVGGTPLADAMEGAYDRLSPLVTPLDCTPDQAGDLASVTRRERLAWLAGHPLPPGIAYHSIVAHAPLEHVAPPLRPTARQLNALDVRNDGQLIAGDAILPGGTLLAEAHADHWDVALPRNRHPDPWVRALSSGRDYPREALLRAAVTWVVGTLR